MDRTIVAPYKAEEKVLNERLYDEIMGLAVVYPMNEYLLQVMSNEMFIKPNQAAFIQVMGYLFKILDPGEFKRRFFWPIADKKSEANFRSTTIEYLKHLNEKHNRQWDVKVYLVQMPGGMRFITFLLDFLEFVVEEDIKQREKQLASDPLYLELTDLDIAALVNNNQLLRDNACMYINDIEEQDTQREFAIQKLHQRFKELAKDTGVSPDRLKDNQFLADFEISNQELCRKVFIEPIDEILALQTPLQILKETVYDFLNKEMQPHCNAEKIRSVLCRINEVFPNNSFANDEIYTFQFNTLLRAFNLIEESIKEKLASNEYLNISEFVMTELKGIQADITEADTQLTEVHHNFNKRKNERNDMKTSKRDEGISSFQSSESIEHKSLNINPLLTKFVKTPTIKLENAQQNAGNARISLHDHCRIEISETSNKSQHAFGPPVHSDGNSLIDKSFVDLNTTQKKSKIVNSMQVLRTLNQKPTTSKHTPLRNICEKWENQTNLNKSPDLACRDIENSTKYLAPTQTSFQHSPRTPKRHESSNSTTLFSGISDFSKISYGSNTVQIKQTSPSGHLEALVRCSGDHIAKIKGSNGAKICENDLIENNNDENDRSKFIENSFEFNLGDINEDVLLDVSDSVLNDVIP